jgi:hypothetical protein
MEFVVFTESITICEEGDEISICNTKDLIFIDSVKNRSPETFAVVRCNFHSKSNFGTKIFSFLDFLCFVQLIKTHNSVMVDNIISSWGYHRNDF